MHKVYNENEQLNLKHTSGVGLGTGLLLVRDRIHFPRDLAPDDSATWPVRFTNTGLTSNEAHNSNTERDFPGILHGLEKIFPTTASPMRLAYYIS